VTTDEVTPAILRERFERLKARLHALQDEAERLRLAEPAPGLDRRAMRERTRWLNKVVGQQRRWDAWDADWRTFVSEAEPRFDVCSRTDPALVADIRQWQAVLESAKA
jgi:hypothetical protein